MGLEPGRQDVPHFPETSSVDMRGLAAEGQQSELGSEGRATFGQVLSKPSRGAQL